MQKNTTQLLMIPSSKCIVAALCTVSELSRGLVANAACGLLLFILLLKACACGQC